MLLNCGVSNLKDSWKSVGKKKRKKRKEKKVPWTAKRSNQSILKEISPEYSLEGLMLKLKLQYFGHLMKELTHWKRPWCWDRLKTGGEGDNRGWDGWMASLTRMDMNLRKLRDWRRTGKPQMLQSMVLQTVGHNQETKNSTAQNLRKKNKFFNIQNAGASRSSLKLTSIKSVMPSNHLILCQPLLLPSILPSIRVFSNESVLHIRWP